MHRLKTYLNQFLDHNQLSPVLMRIKYYALIFVFSVKEKLNTSLSSVWLRFHCFSPKLSKLQEKRVPSIIQIV